MSKKSKRPRLGRPPTGRGKTFSVYLSADVAEWVDRKAAETGESRSATIDAALRKAARYDTAKALESSR